jgi:hypothetical protein
MTPEEEKEVKCQKNHCHECAQCGYERPMTEGEAELAHGLDEYVEAYGKGYTQAIQDCIKEIEIRIKELDGNGGALGTPTQYIISDLAHLKSQLEKLIK